MRRWAGGGELFRFSINRHPGRGPNWSTPALARLDVQRDSPERVVAEVAGLVLHRLRNLVERVVEVPELDFSASLFASSVQPHVTMIFLYSRSLKPYSRSRDESGGLTSSPVPKVAAGPAGRGFVAAEVVRLCGESAKSLRRRDAVLDVVLVVRDRIDGQQIDLVLPLGRGVWNRRPAPDVGLDDLPSATTWSWTRLFLGCPCGPVRQVANSSRNCPMAKRVTQPPKRARRVAEPSRRLG